MVRFASSNSRFSKFVIPSLAFGPLEVYFYKLGLIAVDALVSATPYALVLFRLSER